MWNSLEAEVRTDFHGVRRELDAVNAVFAGHDLIPRRRVSHRAGGFCKSCARRGSSCARAGRMRVRKDGGHGTPPHLLASGISCVSTPEIPLMPADRNLGW